MSSIDNILTEVEQGGSKGEAPSVLIGEFSKSIVWVQEPVTVEVTLVDNGSGIDISNCKWVYSKEANLIGTEDNQYTGGSLAENKEILELKATEKGTYYLHVLTIDERGNKLETISDSYVEVNDTLYLYQNGNQYTDITGGFTYGKDCLITHGENVTNYQNVGLSFNASNMKFTHTSKTSTTEGGGWTVSLFSTKKQIDLTYFNKIYIDELNTGDEDKTFQITLFKNAINLANRVQGPSIGDKGVRTTVSMDISSFSGKHFIGLSGWLYTTKWVASKTGTINIYSLYLQC